jgi:hypothetical protein
VKEKLKKGEDLKSTPAREKLTAFKFAPVVRSKEENYYVDGRPHNLSLYGLLFLLLLFF